MVLSYDGHLKDLFKRYSTICSYLHNKLKSEFI